MLGFHIEDSRPKFRSIDVVSITNRSLNNTFGLTGTLLKHTLRDFQKLLFNQSLT
jgi:hypothetical protein